MVKIWLTFCERRVKFKAWRLRVGDTKSHFQLCFSKQGERGNERQQLLHGLELIHGHAVFTAVELKLKESKDIKKTALISTRVEKSH